MKKIVVVGAGIAGLSAAIYLQRSGFEVTICEQGSNAGGSFSSWERGGYTFEGALEWLGGSNPSTELYQLWKETGAFDDSTAIDFLDPYHCVLYEGQIVSLYRDIDTTARHLLAISPEDSQHIRLMAKDVKKLSKIKMPPFNIRGVKIHNPRRICPAKYIPMLPGLIRLLFLNKISCRDYVEKFKHPALQKSFDIIRSYFRATNLIFTMGTMHAGDGGYPEGGSRGIIQRMIAAFEGLGGKLLFHTPVHKVNITYGSKKPALGHVTGVTLGDKTLAADAVIVTQETLAALEHLFERPLEDAWLQKLQKSAKSSVCTFIGVGIRAEIPDAPVPEWQLTEPITYVGETITEIGFFNHNRHGYAPKGCTVLTSRLRRDTYDNWKKAREEGRYEEEKRALADAVSREICLRYPQARGNIEVIDIATPLTYERYTGAYRGSWMSITSAGDPIKIYPGLVKNVKGLYFAGFRLIPPGGVPAALLSGRRAAQMVCRQFKTVFKAT